MAMALAIFNEYAGVLSNVNACRDFFSWTASVITATRSSWNTSEVPDKDKTDAQKQTEEEIECLKADLWKLETTMPKMLDLIDRVEYQSHKKQAADLLPHIKDAVFEAEDLLDELDYDALKWKVECSKNLELNQLHDTCLEFYDSVRSNDYIRKVNRIQRNLDHVHQQSMEMGLHQAPLKFDRSVRPETTSYFTCEEKMVGREEEMKELVEILGVRGQKRGRTGSKSRMTELPVFSIVGMGGVGKTTMAQQICKDTNVKDHFDHIIWTCVSDDFDIKRLTKEIIEHLGGDASSNNLNVLMGKLEGCVKSKKFLLVLDDMWDDILENNGAGWKSFSAPLKNGAKGSKILVTTRSPEVAKLVGPMNNYELKGLQDEVFWDFFKSCAFGSTSSCSNRKSLECIGKKIVPKLKGSPLAARTIGRLLGMELSTTHWENIMESELWQIEQKEFDILPALRLSYMCLPQKLKRCFSVCAIFPKDHKFAKEFLANIWIAQGYVVGPQEASLCFDALANRSFFQEASPDSNKYVIHDLMHDTAQLVSKDECFIIKHASDLDNVPSNVRHLSILTNRNVQCSELKRICNKKKLRSLVCCESYSSTRDFESVIDCWFKELLKIRVLSFELSRVGELPESMGNSKHLRYLRLLGSRTFSIFPSSVCRLHHLKIIDCGNCLIERFPPGFSDALSLQKIKSKSFAYTRDHHSKLCLNWSGLQSSGHMMEILPHWNIQHLHVKGYRGESFPSWLLQPNLLPSLEELHIRSCSNLTSIVSEAISSSSSSSGVQGFSSLARISIRECHKLLSFDEFLKPDCLPAVKTIWVSFCRELMSLPVDGLDGLQELEIRACNFKLNSQRVMILPPSLKKLELRKCDGIESINLANSRLGSSPVLEELMITRCPGLKSIGGAATVDKIKKVDIWGCRELKEIQQPLRRYSTKLVL